MKFEIGKFYEHTSGKQVAIVGKVKTTMWGETLVAENANESYLSPFGSDEAAAENWSEITKEEWMKNFSK